MGKTEDLRALKDARRAARTTAPELPGPGRPPVGAARREQPEPPAGSGTCGHLSISRKACTRPAGHPETAHRY